MVVTRAGKERMGCYFLMGVEFQFYKMKRILMIDGGDCYTTIQIYLISLKLTLKNG